jgi:hypothetical protein
MSSAQNMKEVAAIDAGKRRGEAKMKAFDNAWRRDGHSE